MPWWILSSGTRCTRRAENSPAFPHADRRCRDGGGGSGQQIHSDLSNALGDRVERRPASRTRRCHPSGTECRRGGPGAAMDSRGAAECRADRYRSQPSDCARSSAPARGVRFLKGKPVPARPVSMTEEKNRKSASTQSARCPARASSDAGTCRVDPDARAHIKITSARLIADRQGLVPFSV